MNALCLLNGPVGMNGLIAQLLVANPPEPEPEIALREQIWRSAREIRLRLLIATTFQLNALSPLSGQLGMSGRSAQLPAVSLLEQEPETAS